jgi:YesN/AraC family two-component response regulator
MKIVVVDDEPLIGEILAEMLVDHEVVHTTNPKRVIELFQESKFDVLITDYNMPGFDGVTLSKLIGQKYNPYIIMITGNQEYQYIKFEHVNSIHRKPIDWIRLTNELKKVQSD